MSHKLPITLVMFTSCLGHFGKDTYEYTINSLSRKFPLELFAQKFVHIKYRDGEEEKLKKMESFFSQLGFHVASTKGNWKHNDVSHYVEHSRDLSRVLRDAKLQETKYIFWMEDDIVLRCSDSLHEHLESAMRFLEQSPETMCVRVLDNPEIIPSLYPVDNENNHIFTHRDAFSFRCNIMRSRDAFTLGSIFFKHFNPSGQVHIERFATEALRLISGSPVPFSCFGLGYLSHIHIGGQNFDPNLQY